LGELGDVLGGHDGVSVKMLMETDIELSSEMHLDAVIKRVWRCIWRLRSSNSEMHLEAMIKRVWRCTWRL
jgi:hypothetical protein